MPDVTGLSLNEAEKILKEQGLEYETNINNLEDPISNQVPKKGITIKKGTKVILYK